MTSTRTVLRKQIYENLGDHIAATTTSSGSTTTVISTTLINEELGGDDDGFSGFWVLITSGSASGEIRRAKRTSGYAASTGTLTVDSVFGASIGSGVTFEIHRYNPAIVHAALNRALARVYPHLSQELLDESLVVDDRLLNSDFETFSGGFTSWTEVGSPTVTQETTKVKHGTSSAKVVSGACDDGQLTQAPEIDLVEAAGTTAVSKYWVWASVASVARLRLDWDGSTIVSGDYHTGDSSWRLLSVSGLIPDDATQVKLILETESGTNTAYFDAGYLNVGPVWRYTIPSTIRKGPHHVSIQRNEQFPEGQYDHIHDHHLLPGRRIQLRGIGALSTVAAEADTTEVDGPAADAICYLAASLVAEMIIGQVAGDDQTELQAILSLNRRGYTEMIAQPELISPIIGVEAPSQKWYVTNVHGSRILHLNTRRHSLRAVS